MITDDGSLSNTGSRPVRGRALTNRAPAKCNGLSEGSNAASREVDFILGPPQPGGEIPQSTTYLAQ
jgi:hypothetical protein